MRWSGEDVTQDARLGSNRDTLDDIYDDLVLVGFDPLGLYMPRLYASPTVVGYENIHHHAYKCMRKTVSCRFVVVLSSSEHVYGFIRPFSYAGDSCGVDFTSGIVSSFIPAIPIDDSPIEDEFESVYGTPFFEYVSSLVERVRRMR